jgi:hypothetical protein
MMKQAYDMKEEDKMDRNRYILCLLLCGWMIYYAEPKLPIFQEGIAGAFAVSWLLFALMVIAGNLSALLYTNHRRKNNNDGSRPKMKSKKKIRSFHS